MEKKARIATIIGLSSLLAVALYLNYEHEYVPVYGIYSMDDGLFGRYSKGNIYIGNEEYIDSVKDRICENDILIVLGGEEEPNVTILSSHEIVNKDERYEILKVLERYNELHPSDWNRSLESMRVEWTVHNILYDLHIERDRTEHVDFENSEEKLYSNPYLRRLIK